MRTLPSQVEVLRLDSSKTFHNLLLRWCCLQLPPFSRTLKILFPTTDDSIPQDSFGTNLKNRTAGGSSNGTAPSQCDGEVDKHGVIDLPAPKDAAGIHALSSLSLDDGTGCSKTAGTALD